jgi:hypothetical protein
MGCSWLVIVLAVWGAVCAFGPALVHLPCIDGAARMTWLIGATLPAATACTTASRRAGQETLGGSRSCAA